MAYRAATIFAILVAVVGTVNGLNCTQGYHAVLNMQSADEWNEVSCAGIDNPVCAKLVAMVKLGISPDKIPLEAGACESATTCDMQDCDIFKEGAHTFVADDFIAGQLESATFSECEVKCCSENNCNSVPFDDIVHEPLPTTQPPTTQGSYAPRHNMAVLQLLVTAIAVILYHYM